VLLFLNCHLQRKIISKVLERENFALLFLFGNFLEEIIHYECLKLYKNNSEGREKAEKRLAAGGF